MIECDLCGARVAGDEMPITWMLSYERDAKATYYCGSCARDNLRSIEGRLGRAYW